MNLYDSARMADVLAPLGYAPADGPQGADMVVLNTCHIREKAAEKVYSELGRLRLLKDEKQAAGERMLLVVAGCVAQAEGEEMLRRAPQVDVVLGPQSYHRLPELVVRAERAVGGGVLETDFPAESKFDFLPEETAPAGADGLSHGPGGLRQVLQLLRGSLYARGRVLAPSGRSGSPRPSGWLPPAPWKSRFWARTLTPIMAKRPTARAGGLGRLLRRLAQVDGLERLRYTTSHPRDMDEDLIAAHADEPKLMPFLHLPVQSGSDRILAAMNRRHSAADYLRLVDRLRAARPDLALSSDFIVGFPGESDRDFAATLRLATDVGFAQAYSFKYSPRPGTPAALEEGQVEDAIKVERLASLQALLNEQQLAFNKASVGRNLPVLLERHGRHPGQLVGRSPYMQAVHVAAPEALFGRVAEVQIVDGQPNSLAGSLPARVSAIASTGLRERVSA